MILRFDRALTNQSILANGNELADIMGRDRDESGRRVYEYPIDAQLHLADLPAPVLVTDYFRICRFPSVLRDSIIALYRSPLRITEYDGTRIEFRENAYPGVWGPSIDTLLFCRSLSSLQLDTVRTVVEIGSGSGFVSKYVLSIAPNLERITLIDLNPNAATCVGNHFHDARIEMVVGDGTQYVAGKKFDLILCNPPYIPRPRSIENNPYEGIGLLVYLLTRAESHLNPGGRVITNISSLGEHLVVAEVRNAGSTYRVIDSMEVPLKVFNVLNNPAWMDYLLREKGLTQQYRDGYDYWHRIQIVEVAS